MSAEQRAPMGLSHVTVVPENFETDAEDEGYSDAESDPAVPIHR